MDISLHWRSGISNGFNNPRFFSFYTILLPYMSQLGKNWRISWNKPGQVNFLLIIALRKSRPE
jgi:hypothetical protein